MPSSRSGSILSALFLLGLAGPEVQADLIPIVNPGFEDLTGPPNSTHFGTNGLLRDGHFSDSLPTTQPDGFQSPDPIPGWTVTGEAGTYNPTTAQFPGGVPEGQNTAFSDGGTISQALNSVLMAGTYTLEINIGGESQSGYSTSHLSLLGPKDVVLQESGIVVTGSLPTKILRFTILADDPRLGSALKLVLGSNGHRTHFDDVRLQFTPAAVPESNGAILFGLGIIVVFGYRLWDRKVVRWAVVDHRANRVQSS